MDFGSPGPGFIWFVELWSLRTNLAAQAATPTPLGAQAQVAQLRAARPDQPNVQTVIDAVENFQQYAASQPLRALIMPGEIARLIAILRNDSAAPISQGVVGWLQILEYEAQSGGIPSSQSALRPFPIPRS